MTREQQTIYDTGYRQGERDSVQVYAELLDEEIRARTVAEARWRRTHRVMASAMGAAGILGAALAVVLFAGWLR